MLKNPFRKRAATPDSAEPLDGRPAVDGTAIEAAMQPDPDAGAPPVGPELVWGGTSLVAGIVRDDHNADLWGKRGILAASKMRRTDAQVRAVTTLIGLPIRSAHWFVTPPDNPSTAEKEATEAFELNLMGGMESSFDALIHEGVLAAYYGFRIPEIVWEERDGYIRIRKIASRNAELVERWLMDENGVVIGYLYVGLRPIGAGLEPYVWGTSAYQRIPVPLKHKTLHFAYEQENENPEGFGLWRSMYPHWYIKQALYKIISIGVERSLLGVPYAETPAGARPSDRDSMQAILANLRAAEDGAFTLPAGWIVKWFESGKNPVDAMPYVQHHNVMIAQGALAQFLNLGQTSAGTQSLADTHAKLFLEAMDGIASWIETTINEQLCRPWTQFNFGPGVRPPILKHRRIAARSLDAMALALTTLVSGELVHPVVQDEEYIRELAELPSVPIEQLKKAEADRQALKAQGIEDKPPSGSTSSQLRKDPGVNLDTEMATDEERAIQLDDDASGERAKRVAMEESFVDQAKTVLAGLQEGYLKRLRPVVEAIERSEGSLPGEQGSAVPDRAAPMTKLMDVEVPGSAAYEAFVKRFLFGVLHAGRAALSEQTGQDEAAERPIPTRLRQWVGARASLIASDHASRIRSAALQRVLTGIRADLPASLIFEDAGATVIEALNRAVETDWGQAAAELASQMSDGV